MRLKNNSSGIDVLNGFLFNYYMSRNRGFLVLSSGVIDRGGEEGDCYYVNYFLDRKYVLRYSIPIVIRTFAGLWIGVGPEYIPIEVVVDKVYSEKFNGDSTTEAILENLALLDECLSDISVGNCKIFGCSSPLSYRNKFNSLIKFFCGRRQ